MYRYKIKYLLIFFLLQQSYGYILESTQFYRDVIEKRP